MPDSSPGDDEDKERACNNGSLKEWKMKETSLTSGSFDKQSS